MARSRTTKKHEQTVTTVMTTVCLSSKDVRAALRALAGVPSSVLDHDLRIEGEYGEDLPTTNVYVGWTVETRTERGLAE